VRSTRLYLLVSKYLHRRGRIISCGSWEATEGAGSSLDDCVSSSWPDESFMVSSLNIKQQTGDQLSLLCDKCFFGNILSKIVNISNPNIFDLTWSDCIDCGLSRLSHHRCVNTSLLFIDQDFKQINLTHRL